MKKPEIAISMARQSKTTVPQAADCLDRMVHYLVHRLRQGKQAHLPKLGTFTYSADGRIAFEREEAKRHG